MSLNRPKARPEARPKARTVASSSSKFKVGSEVEWPWGKGHATGKIIEVYTESVTKTLKGKKITRHGTPEKPAYLIRQANGSEVLKLETELYLAENLHGWA